MREIIGDYEAFVSKTNEGLAKVGIEHGELAMLDHICYRVETLVRYKELLKILGGKALLLGEAEISGRMIATFELSEPLEAGGWRIPYLELPQPKGGSPYVEGLEHAEFVVIGSLLGFQARHSKLPFNTKALNRVFNPELGLKKEGLSVKFHETQLGAVVGIENRLREKVSG